jgi:hypothetical protein
MKKLLFSAMILLVAGTVTRSSAQCATDLPAQLQSCFDEISPGALTVTVIDSSLYISGTLDPSFRDMAQQCIDQYTTMAASCPGAPTIVYDTPPVTGYDSNTSTNYSSGTYLRIKKQPMRR